MHFWFPTVISPLSGVTTTHVGFVAEYNNVHLFYRDGSSVFYKRSVDEGSTWSSAVTVATGAIDEAPLTQCIACNGKIVHVVYSRDVDDVSLPPKLYYKRSIDHGVTWGSEVTFDDGTALANDTKFRVSLVADGTYVHCFWAGDTTKMWQIKSTDDGATWGSKTEVVTGSSVERPEAELDGAVIHLTWTDKRHGSTSNGGEVYYNKSTDRGASWVGEQRITTTASQDTARPTVASNGNYVVLAWQHPIFTEDIKYKYSSDGGSSWSSEQTLTTTGQFEHAALTYAEGIFAIVYTQQDASPTATFSQISYDNGVTWEAALQTYVPSANTAAPLVQFSRRFLIMMDRANATSGVKITRSPLLEPEPLQDTLLDDFNRADDATPPPGSNWGNGLMLYTAGEGLAIVSNQLTRQSSGGYRQGGYWLADQPVEIDLVAELSAISTTLTEGMALALRFAPLGASTKTGYHIGTEIQSTTSLMTWTLTRQNGGSQTTLIVTADIPIFAVGDLFAITARGDLVMCWIKRVGQQWDPVMGEIDTTYIRKGKVGLDFMGGQNYKVTNLWSTTTVPNFRSSPPLLV